MGLGTTPPVAERTGAAADRTAVLRHRRLDARGQPRAELSPAPLVHADLAPTAALAVAHQQRPAARVEVVLGERERLLDAQASAPEMTIIARARQP